MNSEQLKVAAIHLGRWTAAVGLGAVVTYCGAGVAWASEDQASEAGDSSAAAADDRGAESPDESESTTESATELETAVDAEPAEPELEALDDTESEPDQRLSAENPDPEVDEKAAPVEGAGPASVADQAAEPGGEPSQPSGAVAITPVVAEVRGATAPGAPNAVPALLTLTGSARREPAAESPQIATEMPAGEPATAGQAHEPATPETAQAAVIDAAPPAWQELYTGKPSWVHETVVAGLKVLQFVLKPFGGLLRFTSLKIPIFTDGYPPFYPWNVKVSRTEFDGMPVWSLTPNEGGDDVVVALHGGSYEGQVNIFQWWGYTDMARDTGATVVVPLYTLAPRGTATTEVPRTADFITHMIESHGAGNVSVLGDSAGGGLALASVQELVKRGVATPRRLVLLAPWLDVSMSDPRSAEIDDPLLDIPNLRRAGGDWAGELDPADPLASPLFGPLGGLPPTYVYSSSRDLLTVDTLRLRDRVLAENIPDVTFRLRRGLIHDYPIFPFLPDAVAERDNLYRDLLGSTAPRLDVAMPPSGAVRDSCAAVAVAGAPGDCEVAKTVVTGRGPASG